MLYRTIVADPPWEMPNGGSRSNSGRWGKAAGKPADLPYSSLSLAEIASLPVSDLAEPDAHLYLWTPECLLGGVLRRGSGMGIQALADACGAKAPRGMGPGGAFVNTTEYVLFARRITGPAEPAGHDVVEFKRPFNGSHIVHSRKPEGFLDVVEQVSPGPYVELFARRARFGWDYWGDESLETATLGKPAFDEEQT